MGVRLPLRDTETQEEKQSNKIWILLRLNVSHVVFCDCVITFVHWRLVHKGTLYFWCNLKIICWRTYFFRKVIYHFYISNPLIRPIRVCPQFLFNKMNLTKKVQRNQYWPRIWNHITCWNVSHFDKKNDVMSVIHLLTVSWCCKMAMM